MNVSEMTEIALQIMNYKLYDRDGNTTDSLEKMIEKPQGGSAGQEKSKAIKRKISTSPSASEQQFMNQFGMPDFDTILTNPIRYVDSQLGSFIQQRQNRMWALRQQCIMTKSRAKSIRNGNMRQIAGSIENMKWQMMQIYSAMTEADETERLSRTQNDLNVPELIKLKQGLLLREFNMLLRLLKRIMEDLSDYYAQYDFAWVLLHTFSTMM
uniref:Uncharacterized protein n=1 Tax=Anopheles epiroticus TaxID=199890 RepID=A0A182PJQ8_9DIPT